MHATTGVRIQRDGNAMYLQILAASRQHVCKSLVLIGQLSQINMD